MHGMFSKQVSLQATCVPGMFRTQLPYKPTMHGMFSRQLPYRLSMGGMSSRKVP
jgi:hypothetical protein